MNDKLNQRLIEREVKRIWENIFREPVPTLFLNNLRIGNNTLQLYDSDLKMSLDDFSERILMPAIYQYIDDVIKPIIK